MHINATHSVGLIIQARMSSSRFPGKVLAEISGKPMLEYSLVRLKKARTLSSIVVATSTDASDDPIEEFCAKRAIPVYRGSLTDVLDRYYQAAVHFGKNDVIARVTGDCPLIDPAVVDLCVDQFLAGDFDYLANTVPTEGCRFPDGMDVEVFSMAALERAWKEAKKPSEREHVTFYFWKTHSLFKTGRVGWPDDLSKYRLTVDYPQDIEVTKAILNAFQGREAVVSMGEIVDFLKKNPEVLDINSQIKRNAGWQASFQQDIKQGFDK